MKYIYVCCCQVHSRTRQTLLIKTPYTLVTRHREIKLGLIWLSWCPMQVLCELLQEGWPVTILLSHASCVLQASCPCLYSGDMTIMAITSSFLTGFETPQGGSSHLVLKAQTKPCDWGDHRPLGWGGYYH